MHRTRLFTQQELATAFALVLPEDEARAVASRWFGMFADDVDPEGYFMCEPAVPWHQSPHRYSIAAVGPYRDPNTTEPPRFIDLEGYTLDEKREWLLRWSHATLRIAMLASPEVFERVRQNYGSTHEQAERMRAEGMAMVAALRVLPGP